MQPDSSPLDAEVLRAAFVRCGWTPKRCPAIASTQFDTACTPTRAIVYLYPSGTPLHAEYWSEGRNVLSTTSLDLTRVEPDALDRCVRDFIHQIGRVVDTSYARRLWLLGVRPRPPTHALRAEPLCRCA